MFIIISVSILIGFIFAPLGCLVLWKRYVYFGDGLAHASMFAGILSGMSGLPVFYSGLLSSSLFAFTIFKLRNNSGNSAAIGLTTSIMISLSLVLAYSYPGQVNVTKYLVGDIISASMEDIKLLFFILVAVLIFSTSVKMLCSSEARIRFLPTKTPVTNKPIIIITIASSTSVKPDLRVV